MKQRFVRAIALCVFRRGSDIFVAEGYDGVKDQTFYRPLGGTIEFGEYSSDTVRREIQEEICEGIRNLRPLGTLENIFRYEGQTGHEIVILYEADFDNREMYDRDEVTGIEDTGQPIKAV